MQQATDRRAGCGKTARPVRREGRGLIPRPYPYRAITRSPQARRAISRLALAGLLGLATSLVAGSPKLLLKGETETELAPHGQGNVYAPDVHRDGDGWVLWYGGQGRDGHDRIHRADSTDGRHWERRGVAVDCGTANHVNDPSVVRVDSRWWMFYTVAETAELDEIAAATSSDGLHWEKRGVVLPKGGGAVWDSWKVGRPSVLFEEGRFRMWYDGQPTTGAASADALAGAVKREGRAVGYAESVDGLTWTRQPEPVFREGSGAIQVARIGDPLIMVIESGSGVRWASSTDGLSWESHGRLLPLSGGDLDRYGQVTPFLFEDVGALRLFFGAARRRTWDGNAIAVADVVLPPLRGTGQIPVLAWIGPPADQTTPERYRELADAGFNISFSGFPNADAMAGALEIAHAAGVKLMISCPELRSEPETTVRRFMAHPATAGYYLRDEPNAADFAALGEWTRRIRAVDDAHPCYLNLFPTYASAAQLGTDTYLEHVRRFLAEVPVQVLSFDHYPIVRDQLRGDWYENLEIISGAAREADLPFWAFALAVAHDPYPVATVEGLRLQVFSDLAYGARAIQYFTYWTPQSSNWNFHTAPIEKDGTRTEVYDRVRQVNAEVQGLAPVFQSAKVIEVAHLGEPLPKGTRPYRPPAPVLKLDTAGRGAVVSRLRNAQQEYLVIVNRELRETMELTLQFDDQAWVHQFPKQGDMRLLESGTFHDSVEPGDIRVFVWRR